MKTACMLRRFIALSHLAFCSSAQMAMQGTAAYGSHVDDLRASLTRRQPVGGLRSKAIDPRELVFCAWIICRLARTGAETSAEAKVWSKQEIGLGAGDFLWGRRRCSSADHLTRYRRRGCQEPAEESTWLGICNVV